MATKDTKKRDTFGSRFGVLVTMAGSAVGLGNLWRFPYLVGEYGGAAFILIYILCLLLLSMPVFLAEFIIGRRSGANAFRAYKKLAPGTRWSWAGALTVFIPLLITSYYCVVGGWSVNYFAESITFGFSRMATTGELSDFFNSSITAVWAPLVGHFIFLLVTAIVVAKGVKGGIENFSKLMMPLLFIIIIGIAVYGMTLEGSAAGVEYLLKPDFSKINISVVAAAMGQAFFTLSLGCGTIITYASYVKKSDSMLASSLGTSVSDFFFAIIAGFAIMPAVFAFGLNPGAGPGLIFDTLPHIFAQMPGGDLVAILFFFALLIAALTSSISMFEVGVAYLVEEKKMSRIKASVLLFAILWPLGILCSLSFGPLSDFKIFGNTIFDCFDKLSANILMPFGGLLVALFVGWYMKKSDVYDELTNCGTDRAGKLLFRTVYFLLRYVAPPAIVAIFITNLFL